MKKLAAVFVLLIASTAVIHAGSVSQGQQQTGEIVLKSLSVSRGIIIFRTDTGGCTDKQSFTIVVKEVKQRAWLKKPHYSLTIKRIVPDYCKGFFPGGTEIEIDLEKDAGLKGDYTISVTNFIYQGPADRD
ncbi:MAG TPA: hypothetical protein PK986_12095 [Spirochaetota bacterium]|nr:hypothetical protein [Spirochaetota bacterium]HQO41204.1 hypothetical protein [Spirochaetota bacterium]